MEVSSLNKLFPSHGGVWFKQPVPLPWRCLIWTTCSPPMEVSGLNNLFPSHGDAWFEQPVPLPWRCLIWTTCSPPMEGSDLNNLFPPMEGSDLNNLFPSHGGVWFEQPVPLPWRGLIWTTCSPPMEVSDLNNLFPSHGGVWFEQPVPLPWRGLIWTTYTRRQVYLGGYGSCHRGSLFEQGLGGGNGDAGCCGLGSGGCLNGGVHHLFRLAGFAGGYLHQSPPLLCEQVTELVNVPVGRDRQVKAQVFITLIPNSLLEIQQAAATSSTPLRLISSPTINHLQSHS